MVLFHRKLKILKLNLFNILDIVKQKPLFTSTFQYSCPDFTKFFFSDGILWGFFVYHGCFLVKFSKAFAGNP